MNKNLKRVEPVKCDAPYSITGLIIMRKQKSDGKQYQEYQGVPYEKMKQDFDLTEAYEKWLEVTWHDGINNRSWKQ